MPKSETVKIDKDANSVELTNGDATNITLQNNGDALFTIYPGVGANPPDLTKGGLEMSPRAGFLATTVAKIFPGVVGVNRIHASTKAIFAMAYVSHD